MAVNLAGCTSYLKMTTIILRWDGKKIIIGDDALLSNNIEIHTSHYHPILIEGVRTNIDEDVVIGSHVWIGLRTVILKGTQMIA